MAIDLVTGLVGAGIGSVATISVSSWKAAREALGKDRREARKLVRDLASKQLGAIKARQVGLRAPEDRLDWIPDYAWGMQVHKAARDLSPARRRVVLRRLGRILGPVVTDLLASFEPQRSEETTLVVEADAFEVYAGAEALSVWFTWEIERRRAEGQAPGDTMCTTHFEPTPLLSALKALPRSEEIERMRRELELLRALR